MRPPVTRRASNNLFVRMAVVAIAWLTAVAVLGGVSLSSALAEVVLPSPWVTGDVGENRIWGGGDWSLTEPLAVTVDDPATGDADLNTPEHDPDFSTTVLMSQTPWDTAVYQFDLDLGDDISLRPGFTIVVMGPVHTKNLVLTSLEVTEVDLDNDRVHGLADNASSVFIDGGNDEGSDWAFRIVDPGSGSFTADFANPGSGENEAQTVYLMPGSRGTAQQYDDDGDYTHAFWRVPNPSFSVEVPSQVWGGGEDWPVGVPVEVVVDGGDGFNLADPLSFLCYASTVTESGDNPWEQGFYINLHELDDPCDIVPGNIVTVLSDADGDGIPEIYKDLVVGGLSIDGVDPDTGIINGYADAGAWVSVDGGNEWEQVHRDVQAAAADAADPGYWEADLASDLGDGSGWLSVSFEPYTGGSAQVFDGDGDSTHRGWCHDCDNGGDPGDDATGIHIDPIANMIEGGQWPAEAQLTFTFDDPDTEELDCSLELGADGEGVYRFYFDDEEIVSQCDIDPEPGWFVTVTDGTTSRDTEIVPLQITGIDRNTFTVSGIGVLGEVIQVQAFVENDPWRIVTVDDFGNWEVDFSSPVVGGEPRELETITDLKPWFQVRAHRYDFDNTDQQDNDATIHDAQMPRINIGFEGPPNRNPVIESGGWPFGATVDIAIRDGDDLEVWTDTTIVDNLAEFGDGYVEERPRDEGGFFQYYEFPDDFQFEPGLTVEISAIDPEHSYATKSVTVAPLTIESIDLEGNTVSGTAGEGAELFVFSPCWFEPGPDEPGTWGGAINRLIHADELTGEWSVDFTQPGPGLFNDFEVREQPACLLADYAESENLEVGVNQFDDDFDTTQRQGDVRPHIETLQLPAEPVEIGTEINLSATFVDIEVGDTHEAWIGWGDDPDPVPASVIGHTVDAAHTYAHPGVYTVELTVRDSAGREDHAEFRYIVVYDPDGGFVTGGGWIDSPEGAYAPDPTLTGKANFGFVSKYKKGADVPTGNTEFQFHAGELNFHSSEYDWLVVAGPKAMFKGTGTINGEGEYGFMISAIDAAKTPSTEVDLFRIKIWDMATDEIVYDNQMGEDDDADATTEIAGGNIVVHDGKKVK